MEESVILDVKRETLPFFFFFFTPGWDSPFYDSCPYSPYPILPSLITDDS